MRLIIDAGCNLLQGFEKLKAIENITDTDKKIFIEANPECWDILDQKISTIKNSKLFKNALSTTNEQVELITRSDKKTDTAATILGKKFIEDSLNRWNIKINDFTTYSINTITIEQILQEQTEQYESIILKLDAEGVEYAVLQQILDKSYPINKIYCEFHTHNLQDEIKKQTLLYAFQNKNIPVFQWE